MPTLRQSILLLGAVALISGCASQAKTSFDYDRENDFSAYKSWAWISDEPMKVGPTTGVVSPLLGNRIMSAIETSLASKGYGLVDTPESADFVVSFTIGSREEIDVDSYPSMSANIGYAYPRHWRWGGAYYGLGVGTETTVRQYTRGMLAIDMFDVSERRPVWHGTAEKRLRDSDRDAPQEVINGAVDAILAGFPPGAD